MSDLGQDSEKRLHVHTERGTELYETYRDSHIRKLAKSWKLVDDILKIHVEIDDKSSNSNKKQELSKHFEEYCAKFDEVKDFLLRTNSTDSNSDYDVHLANFNTKSQLVREMFTTLDSHIAGDKTTDTKSISRLTRSSQRSSISTVIAKAKAEAARVSMEFALRESELKRKNALPAEEQTMDMARHNALMARRKVEIETDLTLLTHQKKVAVAEAETRVLEEEDNRGDFDFVDSYLRRENVKNHDQMDPVARTKQYVDQQAEFNKRNVTPDLPAEPLMSRVSELHLDEPPTKVENLLNPNAPSFQPEDLDNQINLLRIIQ